MATAAVRQATPADIDEIARIQVSTWRSAYKDLLPTEILFALDPADTARQWLQTIEQGPARVFVATEGEWTVGFCAAGPSPSSESATVDGTPVADAATVALVSALLVEPRWGRRGHGGRLLATATQAAREVGLERGITWVPEEDRASVGFFERAGWAADGLVRTLDAGGKPVREIRITGTLELELVDPGFSPDSSGFDLR